MRCFLHLSATIGWIQILGINYFHYQTQKQERTASAEHLNVNEYYVDLSKNVVRLEPWLRKNLVADDEDRKKKDMWV